MKFMLFIKETKIFSSSDKKNDIGAKPNPNFRYIMYTGLEYVTASPTIFARNKDRRNFFANNVHTVQITAKLASNCFKI